MEIVLPTAHYQPGQDVAGILDMGDITGRCEALLIRLWWVARGEDADTDEIVIAQERTLASGALASGTRIPFSLTLPLSPVSHEGEVIAVRWAVTARVQWPGERPDDSSRQPITVVPGPLPDPAALRAAWTAKWRKHLGASWLDRALMLFKKQPLQVGNETVSPGETVEVVCSGPAVPYSWRLVRIEEAARREVIEHPRTGKRTVYRWQVKAFTVAEARPPPRRPDGTWLAELVVPEDAVASLWCGTRRIRWEVRMSTTGQDVVVPLVVLPGG